MNESSTLLVRSRRILTNPANSPPFSVSNSSPISASYSPFIKISFNTSFNKNPKKEFLALLDSGTNKSLISQDVVDAEGLYTQPLARPVTFELSNGAVTSTPTTHFCFIPYILHSSFAAPSFSFLISDFSRLSVILGTDWLSVINPQIDWESRTLTLRVDSDDPDINSTLESIPLQGSLLTNSSFEQLPMEVRSTSSRPDLNNLSMEVCSTSSRLEFDNSDDVCSTALSQFASLCTQMDLITPLDDTTEATLFLEALPLSSYPSFKSYSTSLSTNSSQLPSQYSRFLPLTSDNAAHHLPPHDDLDHPIDLLPNSTLPTSRPYALSLTEREVLKAYLDDNLKRGFIRHSRSSASSPVFFVPKKTGDLRLVVDYRRLNSITVKDRYPIPLLNDLLDAPVGAKIFTKLDLRNAYNQVRIREGDQFKTAFTTPFGCFEYQVMPFGLCNAPSSFQRLINLALSDLLNVFVVAYLDDLLIYSQDLDSHVDHVTQVLQRLTDNNLFINPEKSVFHTTSVEFLGYVFTVDGLQMDNSKVQTILDWPTPQSAADVQSFLGFANFYRRFIEGYSDIILPLTQLTHQNTRFAWNTDCEDAFNFLKQSFTTAPILGIFDHQRRIIVETDASDFALAAILSQPDAAEVLHPVAFYSRKFTSPEVNYETHDKELLAIVEAFRVWRHYLEGSPFPTKVITDHKNLEYFTTTKVLSRRQARWANTLSPFDFHIQFRPGSKCKPDAITRRRDLYPGAHYSQAHASAQNSRQVIKNYSFSSTVVEVSPCQILCDSLSPKFSTFSTISPTIPLSERVERAQAADPHASQIKRSLATNAHDYPKYSVSQELLYYEDRLYIPEDNPLRLEIIASHHDDPSAGHPGRRKTLQRLRQGFYWPRMSQFVDDYVASCHMCSRAKARRHLPYGLLQPLTVPESPWTNLSMDYIDGLPLSNGFDSILVVVDRFSKYSIFIPTNSRTSATDLAFSLLDRVFSKHGIPESIVSDRGSRFTSQFWQDLTRVLRIRSDLSTAYHPQTDGQTERVNSVLETYLRLYTTYDQSNWSALLPLAEFAVNSSPHDSAGQSPFFINYGFQPSWDPEMKRVLSPKARVFATDLISVHDFVKSRLQLAQQIHKKYADRKRLQHPSFIAGDRVWLNGRNIRTTQPSVKLASKYLGPFPIDRQVSPTAYRLALPPNLQSLHPVFHVSLLQKATTSSIPGRYNEPPPSVQVDNYEEFEVEEILDSRKRRRSVQYLVKWLGYDHAHDSSTWEDASMLTNCDEHVAAFHRLNPSKPRPA